MEGSESSPCPQSDSDSWLPMPACVFRQQLASLADEYVLLEKENLVLREQLSAIGNDPCPVDAEELSTAPCSLDEASQSHEVELLAATRKLCVEALHGAYPVDNEDSWSSKKSGSDQGWTKKGHMVMKAASDFAPNHSRLSAGGGANGRRISNGNLFRPMGSLNEIFQNTEWRDANSKKPIFAHADSMKERVRQQLCRQKYNEADHYKTDGCFQRIARHPAFESVSYMVIALNAIWIAIDTDYNKEALLINSDAVFQITEHCFCLYFVVELAVRFFAFEHKSNAFKDAWFIFDLLLVLLMVLENWVLTVVILIATNSINTGASTLSNTSVLRSARILRITRMARMVRLLRAVPELVILLKGMAAAMRSVFFTLVLLGILLYVFAIAFTQLLEDTPVGKDEFSSVGKSMHTLWIRFTLLDEIVEVVDRLEKDSPLALVLSDLFILAAALTVMNMLVGVLCEVVSAVASSEKEEMSLYAVKAKVERIFHDLGLDEDGNGMISKQEFVKIIENQEAARAMQDLGVDVVGLVDMADIFFSTSDNDENYAKELSFTEFMDTVVALRGSNNATVKDIMDLRKGIMDKINTLDRPGRPGDKRNSLHAMLASSRANSAHSASGDDLPSSWKGNQQRFSLPPVKKKNAPSFNKSMSAEAQRIMITSPCSTSSSPNEDEKNEVAGPDAWKTSTSLPDWKTSTSLPERQLSPERSDNSIEHIMPTGMQFSVSNLAVDHTMSTTSPMQLDNMSASCAVGEVCGSPLPDEHPDNENDGSVVDFDGSELTFSQVAEAEEELAVHKVATPMTPVMPAKDAWIS